MIRSALLYLDISTVVGSTIIKRFLQACLKSLVPELFNRQTQLPGRKLPTKGSRDYLLPLLSMLTPLTSEHLLSQTQLPRRKGSSRDEFGSAPTRILLFLDLLPLLSTLIWVPPLTLEPPLPPLTLDPPLALELRIRAYK